MPVQALLWHGSPVLLTYPYWAAVKDMLCLYIREYCVTSHGLSQKDDWGKHVACRMLYALPLMRWPWELVPAWADPFARVLP